MQLSEQEFQEFLRLHIHLLIFAGQESGILDAEVRFEEYREFSIDEKLPVRSALYGNPELIEQFI
ncbi:MAG: hypothetical protein AAF804_04675, partial [Bacteroidota bacterium]